MVSEVNLSEWIVVKSLGGGYLGKYVPRLTPIDPDYDIRGDVLGAIEEGEALKLCPCFDFICPLRPVQGQGGKVMMQRDPIVVPFDFTSGDVPVYVNAQAVMFCEDLQGADARLYKSFVEQALEMQMRSRAQASGLELATSLPKGGTVRG